jgi:hypothetical protein
MECSLVVVELME